MPRTSLALAVTMAGLLSVVFLSQDSLCGQVPRFGRPVQVRGGGFVADLKSQLEAGLRARRPEEFAFIARIVELVDIGKLSPKLVIETFHWSRRKRPYPYQYFERAIKIRRSAPACESDVRQLCSPVATDKCGTTNTGGAATHPSFAI